MTPKNIERLLNCQDYNTFITMFFGLSKTEQMSVFGSTVTINKGTTLYRIRPYDEITDFCSAEAWKVLDTVKGFEKHMAAILFKFAGEQAIMNLMLADREFEIDDKTLREYRNNAYELIRKRKGMISFYDAIEDARGVAEFTDDDYDRVREKKYPWEN